MCGMAEVLQKVARDVGGSVPSVGWTTSERVGIGNVEVEELCE